MMRHAPNVEYMSVWSGVVVDEEEEFIFFSSTLLLPFGLLDILTIVLDIARRRDALTYLLG